VLGPLRLPLRRRRSPYGDPSKKTLDGVLDELREAGAHTLLRSRIKETLGEAITECKSANDFPEDVELVKHGMLSLLAQESLRLLPADVRLEAFRSQFCAACGAEVPDGRCTCTKDE
jgi:hypothetical protein